MHPRGAIVLSTPGVESLNYVKILAKHVSSFGGKMSDVKRKKGCWKVVGKRKTLNGRGVIYETEYDPDCDPYSIPIELEDAILEVAKERGTTPIMVNALSQYKEGKL